MNKMLGLELREDWIQLAYINKRHNNYNIKKYELDLINYSVDKLDKIKQVILNYISEFNVKTNNIFVVLHNKNIILRPVTFKKLSNKELRNVIANSFNDYLPIDLNNYVVDYKTIYQDKVKTDVLLVASECKLSENIVNMLRNINLKPFRINIFHNSIASYIGMKDVSSCLLVMTYFNKIYIVYLINGHIKNLRETTFSSDNNIFELRRIVNSNNITYDKVYIYSNEKWVVDYFKTNDIITEVINDNSVFIHSFIVS